MVETTTLELSLNELKLLITALYSFERGLENKNTRQKTLLNIYAAEKFFNFDFEIVQLVSTPTEFITQTIGSQFDKLTDAFYELAEKTGTAKPLPPQDERLSAVELFNFCDLDLKTPVLGDLS